MASGEHEMNHEQTKAIRFERVSKFFEDSPVLDNVSFEIERGEAFCVLGRSGTGKTVLLKLMIGMLKPDGGKIFIDQEEITVLDKPSLLRVRKTIGFVFQHAALFDSISVADNVAVSLRRDNEKTEEEIQLRVHRMHAEMGLEKHAEKMPPDLSVGLRKRVGLARALVFHPSILLIDDPSCGVDCFTAREIDRMLIDLKLQHKTTLVIVSDRMLGARRVPDRFAVLDGAHLIFSGSADELRRNDNHLVRQFAECEDL
jgi:phospholipid/cholesterol/gamma-HCH transport system ATP-binding protein